MFSRTPSLILVLLIATCATAAATSQPTTLSSDAQSAAATLAHSFQDRLERSHYLARGPSSDIELDGWKSFPIKRYTYSMTDKDGTKKSADVVLLLPSADQIARWIVSAIIEVRGSYDEALGKKAFNNIIGQSGGQFPVAGIVYEDILPEDGVNETYCFRDGVTVAVQGVPHRKTTPLTPEEIEASIHAPIIKVFTYARIASTTPQQFIAAGGNAEVLGPDGKPTHAWPAEIRKAFQEAWGQDRNLLIVAWIKANANP